jgi:hypothetical protein
VPAQIADQMHGEHPTIGAPAPLARRIRYRAKKAVEPDERHEQGVSLDLTGERMGRDEGITRLEIRARGVDDRIRWTVGGHAGHDEHDQRDAHAPTLRQPC